MLVPDLPPDQRFYAGGSGTVRGYRYQSVGPQFPDGNPVGGTAMSRPQRRIPAAHRQSFGAAVFADAGEVTDKLSTFSGLVHSKRCSASTPLEGTTSAEGTPTCYTVGVGAGPATTRPSAR